MNNINQTPVTNNDVVAHGSNANDKDKGGNGNSGNGNGNGHGNNGDKKVTLTLIVSGTATSIEANPNQKLQVIAEKAIDQTGNTARPLSDWTLKTRDGVALDLNKTVDDYGLTDGSQLVMSLEAGVGGC